MANDSPEVMTAINFEQALEHCYNQEAVDVCLLDYRLGKRDGIKVLKEFRERGLIFPVIFLTGLGDEEVAVSAMQCGAANYFSKTRLDPVKFVKAIRSAIREHKSMEKLEDFLY